MAVIYCYEGSTADIYAQEREFPVVYLCDHDKTVLPAVPPTCTETGLTEGLACSKCGEVYTAQETVPVIDHSHTPSVTTPAIHLQRRSPQRRRRSLSPAKRTFSSSLQGLSAHLKGSLW